MGEAASQSLIFRDVLAVETPGRGFVEVTRLVQEVVEQSGVRTGLCNCFIHHTSASLLVMENADPDVLRDMETFAQRTVPDGDPDFIHVAEGPDDMPAHVRTALTETSLTLPVSDRRCDLGTWQGVFVWEHRHSPHRRRVTVTVTGDR